MNCVILAIDGSSMSNLEISWGSRFLGEVDLMCCLIYLEENLNRAFDQKYAKTFIKGLSKLPLPIDEVGEYPYNLVMG